ncbi:MAG: HAD family hydrolase [Parvibaculaceae bacterium]
MAGGRPKRFGHIKGVLFDKDGTLFDYYQTWIPVLESSALLAARGDASAVAGLMALCGFDPVTRQVPTGSVLAAGNTIELAEIWVAAKAGVQDGELWAVDDLTHALDLHFSVEGPARSVPVTDLVAFFSGLRTSGFHTGIATNDNAASAYATVTRFGLTDHVEFVCGYDSGHGAKPGPGMVHAFCHRVGLLPAEVAMVGDNFHDLEMARRAGAGLKVGVLTGTSAREDLEAHADIVLESITDLPAFLAAHH